MMGGGAGKTGDSAALALALPAGITKLPGETVLTLLIIPSVCPQLGQRHPP
jgi:hypothetical protein